MGESKVSMINLNEIFQDVKSDLIGKLLNETKDSKTCMWYLMCALDGMPDKEILELAGFTIPQIQAARTEFLMKKYQGNSPVYSEVQKLKSQVKEIVQENRDVRSSIEKGLDKAIQEQIEKSNQLIEAKDQMIRMLNLQMVEHKRRIEELQTKVIHLEKQQEDKYDLGQTTGTAKRVLPQSQSVEYQNKNEDISSELEIISEEIRPEEKKQGVGERLKKYFFSTTDTRKFIEKYLNNDKLSDEQKEYLLECLESGMSVKEMDSFASEHLSVDQMKRLSSLYRKQKG